MLSAQISLKHHIKNGKKKTRLEIVMCHSDRSCCLGLQKKKKKKKKKKYFVIVTCMLLFFLFLFLFLYDFQNFFVANINTCMCKSYM